MKINVQRVICFILIIVILTSCWDRRLLKEHSLILAIGYDLNDDGTMSKTVAFPREMLNSEGGEQESDSEVMTTTGDTVGDADIELERLLAQKFDRSKARVLLIGEDLAKYGMFPTLDSMYRDPRGPLDATVAIVKERAKDGLNIQADQSFFTSEFYFDLLKSSEESGIIKRENIQSICPVLLSNRKDIALPLIEINNDDEAYLKGLALFSGDKKTGELNEKQSIMYLLLTKKVKKNIAFNFRIDHDETNYAKNFVTFTIRKEKRKFDVYENKGEIKASIDIHLKIDVEEFPQDTLYKKSTLEKLEKQINKKLTNVGKETIEAMQQAKNDSLGIGEKVKAHYSSNWKERNWHQVYPKVPIEVAFDVEIIQHGIID